MSNFPMLIETKQIKQQDKNTTNHLINMINNIPAALREIINYRKFSDWLEKEKLESRQRYEKHMKALDGILRMSDKIISEKTEIVKISLKEIDEIIDYLLNQPNSGELIKDLIDRKIELIKTNLLGDEINKISDLVLNYIK
ncbi:MAG: hypothetical protein ACP5QF_06980 [Desulfurella sp.]|jgi:hypothetical protein|uniref:hypothetical protein n=1 Tax=Desulfurella sp. TaxID=1962857 RepID=UPI003D0D1151